MGEPLFQTHVWAPAHSKLTSGGHVAIERLDVGKPLMLEVTLARSVGMTTTCHSCIRHAPVSYTSHAPVTDAHVHMARVRSCGLSIPPRGQSPSMTPGQTHSESAYRSNHFRRSAADPPHPPKQSPDKFHWSRVSYTSPISQMGASFARDCSPADGQAFALCKPDLLLAYDYSRDFTSMCVVGRFVARMQIVGQIPE